MTYDCIIVGGGIAGLQAAIQLGRYSAHRVLVINSGRGRSGLCRSYHNLLGWPDGVSGGELRRMGRNQAEGYGVEFIEDKVIGAKREGEHLRLTGNSGAAYSCKTLLLATGVMDRFPPLPGLEVTLGRSVYVCPDCDGYEIEGRNTVVLGAGDAGAAMAFILRDRTEQLTYINHERTPISPENLQRLEEQQIRLIEMPIIAIEEQNDGMIEAVRLADGQSLAVERGFIAFGGNPVHSELADQLGAKLHHNRHVEANPRSMMTSVENVWVAGDLGVHAEQATVAMGEGAIAAIWIHKTLKQWKNRPAWRGPGYRTSDDS